MRETRELTADAAPATGGAPEGAAALDGGAGFGWLDPAQRHSSMTCVRHLAGPPQPRLFTPTRSPAPGQTPPRDRGRLSRCLPVLALLLGAIALFSAAPALAQTPAAPTNLEVATGDEVLLVPWTTPTGTLTGYDVHYTSAPATGSGSVSNGTTYSFPGDVDNSPAPSCPGALPEQLLGT